MVLFKNQLLPIPGKNGNGSYPWKHTVPQHDRVFFSPCGRPRSVPLPLGALTKHCGLGHFLKHGKTAWSLLLTLSKWLVTQSNGVMDPFLEGHGDSRYHETMEKQEQQTHENTLAIIPRKRPIQAKTFGIYCWLLSAIASWQIPHV